VKNMGLTWRRAPLQLFHNDPIDVLYILLYIPTSELMILSITFPTSELVNSVNSYTTME
jgi:hypothetical protein